MTTVYRKYKGPLVNSVVGDQWETLDQCLDRINWSRIYSLHREPPTIISLQIDGNRYVLLVKEEYVEPQAETEIDTLQS